MKATWLKMERKCHHKSNQLSRASSSKMFQKKEKKEKRKKEKEKKKGKEDSEDSEVVSRRLP